MFNAEKEELVGAIEEKKEEQPAAEESDDPFAEDSGEDDMMDVRPKSIVKT